MCVVVTTTDSSLAAEWSSTAIERKQWVDRVPLASRKLGLIIDTAKTKVIVSAMTEGWRQ